MSLRTEYDVWHQHVYENDPAHEDASSPWYDLVRKTIGPVAGLQVLEVACGRGGFVRELARAGARIAGCDFSFSALRVAKRNCPFRSNTQSVMRSVFLRINVFSPVEIFNR